MRAGTYLDPRLEKSARRIDRKLAAAADPEARHCAVPGCSRPTQAAAGRGLSATHCRYHVQFHNRHGSYWRGTLRRAELAPYRAAARRYITARMGEMDTEAALQGISNLVAWHTRRLNVLELRGKDTETKARAALWRLQQADVPPLTILVNHMAITAAVREEFTAGEEYRVVQIAKACLRMAGGYHPQYEWAPDRHHYARSTGRLLRVLGAKLEAACGRYTADHVDGLRAELRAARLAAIDMSAPIA